MEKLTFVLDIEATDPDKKYRASTLKSLHKQVWKQLLRLIYKDIGWRNEDLKIYREYLEGRVLPKAEEEGLFERSTEALSFTFPSDDGEHEVAMQAAKHWFELSCAMGRDAIKTKLEKKGFVLKSPDRPLIDVFDKTSVGHHIKEGRCWCDLCRTIRQDPIKYGVASEADLAALEACQARLVELEASEGKKSLGCLHHVLEHHDSDRLVCRMWAKKHLSPLINANARSNFTQTLRILENIILSDKASNAVMCAGMLGSIFDRVKASDKADVLDLMVTAWSDERLSVACAALSGNYRERELQRRASYRHAQGLVGLLERLGDDDLEKHSASIAAFFLASPQHSPLLPALRRMATSQSAKLRSTFSSRILSVYNRRTALQLAQMLVEIARSDQLYPEWAAHFLRFPDLLPDDFIADFINAFDGPTPPRYEAYILHTACAQARHKTPFLKLWAMEILHSDPKKRKAGLGGFSTYFNNCQGVPEAGAFVKMVLDMSPSSEQTLAFIDKLRLGEVHWGQAAKDSFMDSLKEPDHENTRLVTEAFGATIARFNQAGELEAVEALLTHAEAMLPEGTTFDVASVDTCVLGAAPVANGEAAKASLRGKTLAYRHSARFAGTIAFHPEEDTLTWTSTGELFEGTRVEATYQAQALSGALVVVQWRSSTGALITAVADTATGTLLTSGEVKDEGVLNRAELVRVEN